MATCGIAVKVLRVRGSPSGEPWNTSLILIIGNRSSTDEQRGSGDIPDGDDTTVVEPDQGNGQSKTLLFIGTAY